jgi:hypothetical protein
MIAALILAGEVLDSHPWDILLAIGVIATLAVVPFAVWIGSRWQEARTERLRAQFGDEYDELVDHHGDWRLAEAEMVRRSREHRGQERRSHREATR